MPRKSTVYSLPEQLKGQLDQALLQGRLTIDELHSFVRAHLDDDAPSRSALGRYAKSFNESAKNLRENREVAKALAQELGPESVEGEQGRLLVEMLRGFVFRYLHTTTAADQAMPIEDVSRMARSLRDLAQAMHLEQDFAHKIREQARKEFDAEMRAKVKALGTAQDLKNLTDAELERKIAHLAAN